MCACIGLIKKTNTGNQCSLKSIGTVENPILLLWESDTKKKYCLKTHLAVEIIQEKENAINVSTV